MAPSKPLDTQIREELTTLIKTMVAGEKYNFTWQSVDLFTHVLFPSVDIIFTEDDATAENPTNYTYPSLLNISLEIMAMSATAAMSGSRTGFEEAYSRAMNDMLTLLGDENICLANATNPLTYAGYERVKLGDGNQFTNSKIIMKFKTFIMRTRDNPTIPN
jgi:hypothetical protein